MRAILSEGAWPWRGDPRSPWLKGYSHKGTQLSSFSCHDPRDWESMSQVCWEDSEGSWVGCLNGLQDTEARRSQVSAGPWDEPLG